MLKAPGLERFAADPRTLAEQLVQRVRFDSSHADAILGEAGIVCPAFTSYVENLVSALEEHLERRLDDARAELVALTSDLSDDFAGRLVRARGDLATLAARLDAMSPLKVLARGYAIVTTNGRAVRAAAEVGPGDMLSVRVADGTFDAEVAPKKEKP